jgi:RNA 3'-terminal phosphate cyclase (ATP)
VSEILTVDGALGEGGGQILRTALALSLHEGRPFRIVNIRSGRKKPGIQPQHLAAVKAAAEVSGAEVSGAALASQTLTFSPGKLSPGEYRFSIGTAGSATLVFLTLLPTLLTAESSSRLILEGGTHNPLAPPFEFIRFAFLPLINRMGPSVSATLERPGFYPAGGGRSQFDINPAARLHPITVRERGELLETSACAMIANLPEHIAYRELRVIGKKLKLPADCLEVRNVSANGPGNAVMITIKSEHITEVFTGFGVRGVRAETVAADVVREARRYLASSVPVGLHLADQLILPFALAGKGTFLTMLPSLHTTTSIAIVKKFLDVSIVCRKLDSDRCIVSVD